MVRRCCTAHYWQQHTLQHHVPYLCQFYFLPSCLLLLLLLLPPQFSNTELRAAELPSFVQKAPNSILRKTQNRKKNERWANNFAHPIAQFLGSKNPVGFWSKRGFCETRKPRDAKRLWIVRAGCSIRYALRRIQEVCNFHITIRYHIRSGIRFLGTSQQCGFLIKSQLMKLIN